MRIVRIILGCYFALLSAWCLLAVFWAIGGVNHIHDKVWMLMSISIAILFAALGIVFGLAWWSNWRKWASSKRWAIVASVLALVTLIGVPGFQYFVNGWSVFLRIERLLWLPTAIGLVVLVVFTLAPQLPEAPRLSRPLR